jgi:hypothetical protein
MRENKETNINDIKNLDTCITDLDFYDGLNEIIEKLENVEKDFNTRSMSDYTLYLQGQKIMLQEIIKYLKSI